MSKLVLTIVGQDRAGLVQKLADVVAAHGGNWERSELAELAGAFAGIVLVSVPAERVDGLRTDLEGLSGLLHITPFDGEDDELSSAHETLVFTILGNDNPGIVREITRALADHGLSIDRLTSQTREAPMAGGVLFEATVSVRTGDDVDLSAVKAELERIAGEIQVDLDLG